MLAWLAPILVLGLVVFVHEAGHFIAAKIVGVYAPRFSLGWGSPLWRWRPKGSETEYVISWLPIGGYVRMASRDDETMAKIEGGTEVASDAKESDSRWDPEAMIPHGPKPIPENRWFESKSTPSRVFILLAGVTMNIVLTMTVITSVYAGAGLDFIPAVVDSVMVGQPAEKAGFLVGDSIVTVDGARIRFWEDFQRAVSARPNQQVRVGVVRAGAPRTFEVIAEVRTEPDRATGEMIQVGKIGLGPVRRIAHARIGVGDAIGLAWTKTWTMAGDVGKVVRGLVRGSVGVKQLGGPIAIARASVQSARSGWLDLLGLISFLSVNLAVLNLLPIPILDGGQILLTVGEGVRGKPFTVRTRENFMKVGLAFILVLFSIVMFNDISALIRG